MRYFIELSYNGKSYHGWQNQPKSVSVQEVIEDSLSKLLNETIAIVGAGRTDAGVHASQMFAHFDTQKVFIEHDLVFRLNSFLPKDIAIHNIVKVVDTAHARFDALSRKYLYRITLKKNVFTTDNVFYVKQDLDVHKMNEASKILFQYKDFQCFSKTKTDVKTFDCHIMEAEWFFKEDELHFVIKADRFLRNMVRAIVGTMVNIGISKLNVEDLHTIINSKDRSEAGFSVPAHALYLTEVVYPNNLKI